MGERFGFSAPPPGAHGGDGPALAAALGVSPSEVLDLSQSLNPFAPDLRSRVRELVDEGVLSRYPDESRATAALGEVIGCDPRLVVPTNGGAEAIALVAAEVGRGFVAGPEFSLYEEHLRALRTGGVDPSGARFRSNPNNPLGTLADPSDSAEVWDEAFYPLATGAWSRRDFEQGAFVVGSLTKLFACPGLRAGYVVAPDEKRADAIRARRPHWSLNSLACELLPDLLAGADLERWAGALAKARAEMACLLRSCGLVVHDTEACWLLVEDPGGLRDRLAEEGVLVRDCASFGLRGTCRIAVLAPERLERVAVALDAALARMDRPRRSRHGGLHGGLHGAGGTKAEGTKRARQSGRARKDRFEGLRGAVMVCGTGSEAGKSAFVTGLCRLLARRGVSVAPFKGQNMSLNSFVTKTGGEIGRAQGVQALAAGVEAEVDMNPVLLKPTGARSSQVVVLGRPVATMGAAAYQAQKADLRPVVVDAFLRLMRRFDVVVMEGAGSPAEVNLMEGDLVNLGLAAELGVPALLVGDIERGGMLASIYGTVGVLPPELSCCLQAFVVNKFRGDESLLLPGIRMLERRTGLKHLGIIPYVDGLDIDAEDSLVLDAATSSARLKAGPAGGRGSSPDAAEETAGHPLEDEAGLLASQRIEVAAIRLPCISNATDLDALAIEPAVSLEMVESVAQLGDPDLVIIPGTKATLRDLAWLRERGLADAIREMVESRRGPVVLGICGGYQMLGTWIDDDVEAGGSAPGLGLLGVRTVFDAEKLTRSRAGRPLPGSLPVGSLEGIEVDGYEIHHGRPETGGHAEGTDEVAWFLLHDRYGREEEGRARPQTGVFGTSLHGIFESDAFRNEFLSYVASRRGKRMPRSGVHFAKRREVRMDLLADLLERHCDVGALCRLIQGSREPLSGGELTAEIPAGGLRRWSVGE